MKTGKLYRTFSLDRASVNEENRTVSLSFSSEAKIPRWFGNEVLDHGADAVRLDRLNSGAPVLMGHDTDHQVGVVESAAIGSDRKGRATVRFGKGAQADEVFQDVKDGIRRNVSVGYQIHSMQLEDETDGVATYRAIDWEPFEVSMVAVPADNSVGVGRSAERPHEPDHQALETTISKKRGHSVEMNTDKKNENRALEIIAIGQRLNLSELAQQAVLDGTSLEDFRKLAMERAWNLKPIATPSPSIGMTRRECDNYSIVRAIDALARGDWSKAGLEREASAAAALQLRKDPRGVFVPFDVQIHQRDLTKGVGSAGGYTVATDLLASSFIDLLRNRMMVLKLGGTYLPGLQGDIAIPSLTGAATAYWVAESGAPSPSQETFGQVAMTPKTVGAYVDISRKLILQSTPYVEALVQRDLTTIIAIEVDRVAINGSGSSNQPTGILQQSGIGSVAGGTNGAAPTWANIVALETAVANANADLGALGYLTNSKVRGKLKTTDKTTGGYGQFVWSDQPGPEPGVSVMNSYRAGVSNNVPSTLTKGSASGICSAILFGDWNSLIIGQWGALDLLVDPYTNSTSGTIRVRVLNDVDVAVRHAASFAVMADALTT